MSKWDRTGRSWSNCAHTHTHTRVSYSSIDVCINHLFYADDLCLMAPSPMGLQHLINICGNYGFENDILFNRSASVCMVVKPSDPKNNTPLTLWTPGRLLTGLSIFPGRLLTEFIPPYEKCRKLNKKILHNIINIILVNIVNCLIVQLRIVCVIIQQMSLPSYRSDSRLFQIKVSIISAFHIIWFMVDFQIKYILLPRGPFKYCVMIFFWKMDTLSSLVMLETLDHTPS